MPVYFGSETGNSEEFAETIGEMLSFDVASLEDVESFEDDDVIIIICSTQGDGDMPSSVEDIWESLNNDEPDLSGKKFAVCGLGDSSYDEFCKAGRLWFNFLKKCGAEPILDKYYTVDDSGDAEDDMEKFKTDLEAAF
eukprot:TRINITY_DN2250_c0_g2_i1.p3 TRINITY_DN2250_c0_g2~~TRINITY_DN2250_c0_g2_i1.p3  ORF type:complete len:138 (+),score=68.72 TRINITY_DN2250_c0_g2_i1:31-444(+)